MQEIDLENTKNDRTGLIIVNTGDGKGKTTAAIGTAYRALGWGWKVSMIQFIKGAWDVGEYHTNKLLKLPFEILPLGSGFTWETKNKDKDIEDCERILKVVEEKIEAAEHDIIIVDEINVVLGLGYLKPEKVLNVLNKKPKWMTIFLTGRNAPREIIDYADLVTEMKPLKHPFDKGIIAQKGIEF